MKKLIPLAVASAVLGINTAQAVHVNPDGLGQVLLFPFYTVEGGHDTYINLVNTTDEVVAVKVRFRESMNSAEVLDFNLYMSPFDHWSAVVTADVDGEGASIATPDTSCTVPNSLGEGATIDFRNLDYLDDAISAAELAALPIAILEQIDDPDMWIGLDRTREGYVEVIQMGVVTDSALEDAATHGPTQNCSLLETAFISGIWTPGNENSTGITAGSGGLYGYGVLIDVNEGTDASYDAVALDDFNTVFPIHANPGDSAPSLGDAFPPIADVIDDASIVTMSFSGVQAGLDAVSAVLMKSSVANDYVLEPSIAAGTDWVMTFPTKRAYTNGVVPIDPFTSTWDKFLAQACEEVNFGYWDREENFIQPDPDDLEFSPRPIIEVSRFSICHEANVLTFNPANRVLPQTGVLEPSVRSELKIDVLFDNGWAAISLTDGIAGPIIERQLTDGSSVVTGLPVTGFAVQRYVNGQLTVDGDVVLSNYEGTVSHKTETTTFPAAPAPLP